MENQKHYTWNEAMNIIHAYNEKRGYHYNNCPKPLVCRVVYSTENTEQGIWDAGEYSLENRTYEFSSAAKYFHGECCGSSLFADSLDCKDTGVRLDWYTDWIVDYCYFPYGEEMQDKEGK